MNLQELIYQSYNPDYIEGDGVESFNVTEDPDGYYVDFSLQLNKFLNKNSFNKDSFEKDSFEKDSFEKDSFEKDSKKVLADDSPLILSSGVKDNNSRTMVLAMEEPESSDEEIFKDDSQVLYEDTGEFDHLEKQGVKFDDSIDYFKINNKMSITDFIKVLNK